MEYYSLMKPRTLIPAVVLLLAACAPSRRGPPSPSAAPLRFLLVNDVYVGDTLRDGSAGLARVAALRDSLARSGPVTFGNHEFELDRDSLIARIAQSHFRWTSANCMMRDGKPFPRVSQWDIATVSGVRVGTFALTLRGDYRSYVKCSDP